MVSFAWPEQATETEQSVRTSSRVHIAVSGLVKRYPGQ